MLCDNVLPNLNISRLAIGKLNTDVKSTYNTKIFLLWYPFQTIRTLLLLIGFPTNTKNSQLHGILQISVQISMFSLQMKKVAFSA